METITHDLTTIKTQEPTRLSALAHVLRALLTNTARTVYELPRGLLLVYHPPNAQGVARLITTRHNATPSPRELAIVKRELQAVLDQTTIATLTEWQDLGVVNHYGGSMIEWAPMPAARES